MKTLLQGVEFDENNDEPKDYKFVKWMTKTKVMSILVE